MQQLSKRDFVIALVGLAFSWAFFSPSLLSAFFLDSYSYTISNEIILLTCTGLFLAAAILRQKLESFIRQHRSIVTMLILLNAVGYGLLFVNSAFGNSTPLTIISLILLSLGYVSHIMSWIVLLTSLPMKQTTTLLSGSVIVYALLLIFNAFPTPARLIVHGAAVTVSGLCWALVSKTILAQPKNSSASVKHEFSALRHGPVFLLGLLAVLLIGAHVVIGLYFRIDNNVSIVEILARFISIACVMTYCIQSTRHDTVFEKEFRNAWMSSVVLFLFGVIMIIGLGGSAVEVGLGVTRGVLICFEVLAYLIMFQFVKNDHISPIMVFGFGIVVFKVLPITLHRLIFSHIPATLKLTIGDFAPIITFILMAVLVCILAFSNHRKSVQEMQALEQPDKADFDSFSSAKTQEESPKKLSGDASPNSFDAACQRIAQRYCLSDRETEIMRLIAHGHSRKHISETLYLATGTVQWYAKSIYSKLGVHSKQELINLANNEEHMD